MPKWVQALIDITILISELIAGGWLLYGLLRVCARHTATSRFWQSFFVTTFVAATFAFCLGEQWHLSVGSAVVVATVAACLAMYVLCSVTLKQAAGIAILFVVLMGGMQAGVTILMDRVMPNRWTFAQQYALAEAEANRMSVSTKSFFNFRDTLAVAMDALAKFTNRKDAEILNTDVAVGLAVLRERRAAATNREEVVANQEAFAELSQELLGTPGQTGAVTVTVADIRAALERMPRTQSSNESLG
ncbi:MAG: hypothetical protein O3B24_03575 [Verrucomicrobia bacterium]|nr:hypothetical protein [Verrucomicrobiota bacterium]